MPVWAALSDSIFSRKFPSRRLSLALLIGAGGVLNLWTGDPETRALSIWGPLMVILGGACWGLGTSFVKRRRFQVSPLVLTGWMQVLCYYSDPAGGGDLGLGKHRFTGTGTISFPRLQHSGGWVFDLLGEFCSGAEAFGDGVYDFLPCRASDCGFGGCSDGGFLAGLE